MSLLCAQTMRRLMYGEPLHVVTRPGDNSFAAISVEIIALIQPDECRSTPCPADEKGFDINVAVAGCNPFRGTYSWLEGFEKKDFLFSISEETAKRVIPAHWTRKYDSASLPPEPAFRVTVAINPPELVNLLDPDKSRLN